MNDATGDIIEEFKDMKRLIDTVIVNIRTRLCLTVLDHFLVVLIYGLIRPLIRSYTDMTSVPGFYWWAKVVAVLIAFRK